MPGLMRQRLDRLRLVDVAADPHGPADEVGDPVGRSAVAAFDGERTPGR